KGTSNHGKGPVPCRLKEHIANIEQTVYIACLPGDGPHPRVVDPQNHGHKEGHHMAAQPALRVVEGAAMDKSKALDAALSQIERAFGKGSTMRLGKHTKPLHVQTIPPATPSVHT